MLFDKHLISGCFWQLWHIWSNIVKRQSFRHEYASWFHFVLFCYLLGCISENLPAEVHDWNVIVGSHPHPGVFPNGHIFGSRAPDNDQLHKIYGTRQELVTLYPKLLSLLLHERVTRKSNGFVVVYPSEDDDGKKITVVQEEGTTCPAMRTLN